MTDNSNTTNIGISIISVIITFFLPQLFVPSVIYDYSSSTQSLQIWNVGLSTATDVIIEINPTSEISVNGVIHSELDGEPLTDLSKNDKLIFHVYHIYPKDMLFFTLDTDQNLEKNDIKVTIRANEGSGIEASGFFKDFLLIMQVFLLIVSLALGVGIFFTLNKYLDKKHKN